MRDAPYSWHRFIVGLGTYGLSMTVMAAAELQPSLQELPWAQVCVGAALALWGGLTRTAEKLLDAKRNAVPFFVAHEILRDVMASVLIAALTVFLGAWNNVSIYLLGFGLGIGGYLGSPLLARLGQLYTEKFGSLGAEREKSP